tara:strand:+ start:1252 stop:1668 length:417 start_codon:yes stop_codon:yes gene_type:complete
MEEKKLGRPSKYSTTIVKNILNRLAKGEAIRNVVKEEGIDWETWRQWLIKKPGLAHEYAVAKQHGIEWSMSDLETLAMQTLKRAREKQSDMNEVKAVDTLIKHKQWKAQKLFPRVYGDRHQLDIGNADGKPFEIAWEK